MKKYLITTSADDRFAPGVAVLLHSLKKHMTRLEECDIKVFYTNLSEESKKLISSVKQDVIFEKPKNFDFCKGINTLYGKNNQDTYLCFHAFRQDMYEKVICLDSDMMCIGDISPLLDYSDPMLASFCRKPMNFTERNHPNGCDKFNAGFMVINKQNLEGHRTYNRLVEIVKSVNKGIDPDLVQFSQQYKIRGKKSTTFNDQDVIKMYWNSNPVRILPDWYNFKYWGGLSGNATILEDNKKLMNFFDKNLDKIKIVHYSGKRKPWGDKTKRDDGFNGMYDVCSVGDAEAMLGVKAVDMWHDYYEECFGTTCETDWYHRR